LRLSIASSRTVSSSAMREVYDPSGVFFGVSRLSILRNAA
jgi:hypothetical protein